MRLFFLILLCSFLPNTHAIELDKERQLKLFKNDALLEIDRRIIIHDKFKKCIEKATLLQDGLDCTDQFIESSQKIKPENFYIRLMQRLYYFEGGKNEKENK